MPNRTIYKFNEDDLIFLKISDIDQKTAYNPSLDDLKEEYSAQLPARSWFSDEHSVFESEDQFLVADESNAKLTLLSNLRYTSEGYDGYFGVEEWTYDKAGDAGSLKTSDWVKGRHFDFVIEEGKICAVGNKMLI